MSESKIIIDDGRGGGKSQTLQQMCDDMVYADILLLQRLIKGEITVSRFETFRFIESPPHDYWNQFKRKKY